MNLDDWVVIFFREAYPGEGEASIEDAIFRYGRNENELARDDEAVKLGKERDRMVGLIPNGLISVIRHEGLEEVALESGVLVEMRKSRPSGGGSWHHFEIIAKMTKRKFDWMGKYEISRYSYFSVDLRGAVEFVPLLSREPLPKGVWIRVSALPDAVLAWAVGEGVLSRNEINMTLDDFFEIGCRRPSGVSKRIPLPGPKPEGGCC